MNHDTQSQVKSFFDGYARAFNAIYEIEQRPTVSRLLDRVTRRSMFQRFDVAAAHFRTCEVESLLDVGCGPGQHVVELARSQGIRVHGIDIAPSMIEIAEKLTAEAGLSEQCHFTTGDFIKLDVPPADACLSLGVVEYIENPVPFVRRMCELAGKTVAFSLPVKWHMLTPQRVVRYRLRECPLWFYSRRDIADLMRLVGATKYKVQLVARDYIVMIDSSEM